MNPNRHSISSQFVSLRQRVFGQYSFSLQTFLIVVVPATILTVIADPAVTNKGVLAWTMVVISASVISGVFFATYGKVVFPLGSDRYGWVIGFIGYAVTGALRGGLIGLLSQWSGVVDTVNWQFRLGGGALIGAVLLPVAAVFVSDFYSFRSSLSELVAGRKRLAELTESAQAELDAERVSMLESINSKLTSAVDEISSQASPGQSVDTYRALVNNMLAVAETIVRPLSRQLLSGSGSALKKSPANSVQRGSFAELISAASLTQPFRPLPVSLIWAVIGASTMSALKPGFPEVLAYPLFVVMTGVMLWLGKVLIKPLLPNLSVRPRIFVILSWFIVVAVVPAVVSWIPLSNTRREGFSSLALTLLVLDPVATFLMCVILATIFGLRIERERILSENNLINEELRWKLASLRGLLRAQRQELSRTVHGDIQTVFIAVALKLQSAIASGDVEPQVLQEIKQELSSVVNFTIGAKEYPPLERAIDELRSLWGDSISISFTADPEALDVSKADDVLRATTIDVITEAVTNAVKHGSASQVSVAISRRGDTIDLTVQNNGKPLPKNMIQGAGSELIAEVAVNYSLTNTKSGVVLTAVLPLFTVKR